MTLLHRRAPLLLLEKPENVFKIKPIPAAFLVDLEGTLTKFSPSQALLLEALTHFEKAASQNGIDTHRIHYVTNAKFRELASWCPEFWARIHTHAHKPFWNPPKEYRLHGRATVVLGDQYLTDGLLAWMSGFSFALVRQVDKPVWSRVQRSIGCILSPLFFRMVKIK